MRPRRLQLCLRLGIWLALAACGDDRRPNETKRIPRSPPAPTIKIPATLDIAVEIDGRPAPSITAATLEAHAPDFADPEHRAWRISTLLGAVVLDHTIAATGADDVTIELRASPDPRQPVPTLMITRRGELVAALVDPRDPFPDYHGQGRRLGRRGDPLPRLGAVTKIRVATAQP